VMSDSGLQLKSSFTVRFATMLPSSISSFLRIPGREGKLLESKWERTS